MITLRAYVNLTTERGKEHIALRLPELGDCERLKALDVVV
jgi:hypothetical protein